MRTGIELISDERKRQVEVLGYTAKHDDIKTNESLANAASCYAMTPLFRPNDRPPYHFPWTQSDWKPSPDNRIKELVKAGALIAAEIDRLQRLNNK